MINNKNLHVGAVQKKQQDFTITQTMSVDFVINATNEDEALEKFHDLRLQPSEYFTHISDNSLSVHNIEVVDSRNCEESDPESRCIIKDVNLFRESEKY